MSQPAPSALGALLAAASAHNDARDSIRHRVEVGRLAEASGRSLRELSQQSQGRLSRTYLHRCKAAYRLAKSFPFLLESRRLCVSHLDAVERLPRPGQQRLLLEAERQGWSVRALRERASREKAQTGPETASVPRVRAVRRALLALERSLTDMAEAHASAHAGCLAALSEIERGIAEAHELARSLLERGPRQASVAASGTAEAVDVDVFGFDQTVHGLLRDTEEARSVGDIAL